MTAAQHEAYQIPRTGQKARVWELLTKYPVGLTPKEAAEALDLPQSTITARFNDFQKLGMVYKVEVTQDDEKLTLYRPELNPAEWPRRATHFKRFNHYVAKFARKVKGDGLMTPRLLSELETLFLKYAKAENL